MRGVGGFIQLVENVGDYVLLLVRGTRCWQAQYSFKRLYVANVSYGEKQTPWLRTNVLLVP